MIGVPVNAGARANYQHYFSIRCRLDFSYAIGESLASSIIEFDSLHVYRGWPLAGLSLGITFGIQNVCPSTSVRFNPCLGRSFSFKPRKVKCGKSLRTV